MLTKEVIKEKLLSSKVFNNINDLDLYIELIFNNLSRKRNQGGSTQLHHILPRCIFKYFGKDVDESNDNKVNLLYKDHIMAHYYLCLACSDSEIFYRLYFPVRLMVHNKRLNQDQLRQTKEFLIQKIAELQDLENIRLQKQLGKDKEFYDQVNEYLKQGLSTREIDKKFNLNEGQTKALYGWICKSRKWKSIVGKAGWPHKPVDYNRWNEFYDKVNEYFAQGLKYEDIDKILNVCTGYTNAQYWRACKIINKPNKCPFTAGGQLNAKEEDINWYNKVNEYLKQGKTFKDLALIMGTPRGTFSTKYKTICIRYNLQNLNFNGKNKYQDKEVNINFYNDINNYLNQGLNWIQINKILGKSESFAQNRYRLICKKYNLKPYKRNKKEPS